MLSAPKSGCKHRVRLTVDAPPQIMRKWECVVAGVAPNSAARTRKKVAWQTQSTAWAAAFS